MKQNMHLFLAVEIALFLSIFPAQAAQQSSVSQYGITWTFNRNYEVGQFANGDFWVVGPVTITRITPDFNGTVNGWEVNPARTNMQGMHARMEDYDASLIPTLPYTAQPNESILKSIALPPGEDTCAIGSSQPNFKCLDTAAVLTVLASVPPNNGSTIFRPPFVGSDKPLYSTQDLRTDLLPSLQRPAGSFSLEWVKNRFAMPQTDYQNGRVGRSLRPYKNYPGDHYGSVIGNANAEGALGLMFNDPLDAKMPALINYVQAGIDALFEVKHGRVWAGAGAGVEPGFKITPAFAAAILDKPELKILAQKPNFMDNQYIQPHATNPNRGLYGTQTIFWSDQAYWSYLVAKDTTGDSARAHRDPYRFIDGEIPAEAYQYCCTFSEWKGSALAASLVPGGREVWSHEKFFEYVVRYDKVGTWTQPDPCAPHTGTMADYGKLFGPDPKNPGMCILDADLAYYYSPSDFACQPGKECGRYPKRHALNANSHLYSSSFINSMWSTYRSAVTSPLPPPPPSPPRPPSPPVPGKPDAAAPSMPVKNIFNPTKGESIEIGAIFPVLPTRILIYDRNGNLVRSFEQPNSLSTWNGRNEKGEIVAAGVYAIVGKSDKLSETKKVVLVK